MYCHISTQVPAFFLENSTEKVAGLSEFVVTVHSLFMTLLSIHRVFASGSDCHSVTPTWSQKLLCGNCRT